MRRTLALALFVLGIYSAGFGACSSSSPPSRSWRRLAMCASCDSACRAAVRAWRAICGECASRCSLRPDRSSRSVSAWRKSFPIRSRLVRCARCRSCCCSARCSIGCGGSAAAAKQRHRQSQNQNGQRIRLKLAISIIGPDARTQAGRAHSQGRAASSCSASECRSLQASGIRRPACRARWSAARAVHASRCCWQGRNSRR
jgi:hypothetical protein